MSANSRHEGRTLENYFDIFLGKNITRDLALDLALKDADAQPEKGKASQMRMEAALDSFGEKEWFNPELDESENFESFPCLALSVRAIESDYLTLAGMKRIRVSLRENEQGEIVRRDSRRARKNVIASWMQEVSFEGDSGDAAMHCGASAREQRFNENLKQFLLQDDCLVRNNDVLMRCTASQGCDFNAVAVSQEGVDQWNQMLKMQVVHEEMLMPDGSNEVLPGSYSLDAHPEDGIPAGLLSVYLKTCNEGNRRYRWIPVRSSHHSFVMRPTWAKPGSSFDLDDKAKKSRRELVAYLRSYLTTSYFQQFVQAIASDGLLRRVPLKQLKNQLVAIPSAEDLNDFIKMLESLQAFRVRSRMTAGLMDDILSQSLTQVATANEVDA